MADPVLARGFVHQIDPVLASVGGVAVYWYGLAYALGFAGMLVWFSSRRGRIGMTESEVYDLCILIVVAVLLCGRAFEIIVYEWEYYRTHLTRLFSFWRGGMASHGVLIGCALGMWLYCRRRHKPFLRIADEVVIPGAVFLALGRIGNFINGQIAGYPTDVWWGVKFPGLEEIRHPVALYESIKNFALVPILLVVARRYPLGRGLVLAHFIFWYGFLRLFTDYFREYGGELFGIGKGQFFNLGMALLGLALMYVIPLLGRSRPTTTARHAGEGRSAEATSAAGRSGLRLRQAAFAVLAAFCLTIPSGWTQGVLDQYRRNQLRSSAASDARVALARCRVNRTVIRISEDDRGPSIAAGE